jgi:hypothetical protein
MHLLESGHFNRFEPHIFDAAVQSIREPADLWMTAADFRIAPCNTLILANWFASKPNLSSL